MLIADCLLKPHGSQKVKMHFKIMNIFGHNSKEAAVMRKRSEYKLETMIHSSILLTKQDLDEQRRQRGLDFHRPSETVQKC
jgi:hypothetical protein